VTYLAVIIPINYQYIEISEILDKKLRLNFPILHTFRLWL